MSPVEQAIVRFEQGEIGRSELIVSLSKIAYTHFGETLPERPDDVSSEQFAIWYNAVEDGVQGHGLFDEVVKAKNAKRIDVEVFLAVRFAVYGA